MKVTHRTAVNLNESNFNIEKIQGFLIFFNSKDYFGELDQSKKQNNKRLKDLSSDANLTQIGY